MNFRTIALAVLFFVSHIAQADTIRVAAPEIYPFVYQQNSQVSGSLTDCIAKSDKHQFEIVIMPWARAIQEVKLGRVDAIFPTLKTDERQSFLVFPDKPLIEFRNDYLVSLKERDEPAKALLLGKLRSSPSTSVKHHFDDKNVHFYEGNTYEALLQMLLDGKVDYLLGDYHIISHLAVKLGYIESLVFKPLSDETVPSYLAFSKVSFDQARANSIMADLPCDRVLLD